MDKSNDRLYEDGVIEILSRMTVKSLMRFKCLSKSWYALIGSHTLAYKHLKSFNDGNTRLVVTYEDPFQQQFVVFPDETLSNLSYEDLGSQKPAFRNDGTSLMGPYHGLFFACAFNSNRIIIWNPATGESKLLPRLHTFPPSLHTIYHFDIGFHWDHANNDYKLILLRTVEDENGFTYVFPQVSLYTVSTNYWREFEVVDLVQYRNLSFSPQITCLNEVCFWLAGDVILSFHMDRELFKEMDIDGPCFTNKIQSTLELCDDCLSLAQFDTVTNHFEIWIMRERYWIKQSTIGPLPALYHPLGLWKNGAILASAYSEQFLIYNPIIRETREVGITSYHIGIHKYKESLIPINQDNSLSNSFDIPWHILGVGNAELYIS